jgi:hypothetical protein
MSVSNLSQGSRPGVCLSSSRPTVPYEGQMIYETDTDMVAIWNGTAWRYISATTATSGTVLQAVYGTTSTQVTNNTDVYADTLLTATITPKSSSSKVLVMVSQNGCFKTSGFGENRVALVLRRGATNIGQIAGNLFLYTGSALSNGGAASISVLDSPATTSATVYKTQLMNPNNTASAIVQENGAQSTIVLMEIAA